jgi:hypothetical protein
VNIAFVKEGYRKKRSILFTIIMPMAKIVESLVQVNCDMTLTSAKRNTCR